MAEELNVNTFEQIASLLSILANNYGSLMGTFYDVFYNPEEKDVTFEMLDGQGVAHQYTINNLALANRYRKEGTVYPESTVDGSKGTIYQDRANGELFIKKTEEGNEGWFQLISKAVLDGYILQGNVNPNGTKDEETGEYIGTLDAAPGTLYVNTKSTTLYMRMNEADPGTGEYWYILNATVEGFARSNLENVSTITGEGETAINNLCSNVINSKLVTSINSGSSNEQIPSAKGVWDFVDPTNTAVSSLSANVGTLSTNVRTLDSDVANLRSLLGDKQDINNITQSVIESNTKYPSASCLYNALRKNIILSGAVTGSATVNPASNSVSISTAGQSKVIQLTGDVTGSATFNTGNANTVSIATSLSAIKVDGQWVNSYLVLSDVRTKGTYQINLGTSGVSPLNYLPTDNYNYEVLLIGYLVYTEGQRMQTVTSSVFTTSTAFNVVSSGATISRSPIILPVGTDRIITYDISNTATAATLYAIGYRRIGTNS